MFWEVCYLRGGGGGGGGEERGVHGRGAAGSGDWGGHIVFF